MPGDDYKSALQERLQSRGRPLPDYLVVDEIGPAHRRLFRIECRVTEEVLACGEGRTKKEAEQEAARLALAQLQRRNRWRLAGGRARGREPREGVALQRRRPPFLRTAAPADRTADTHTRSSGSAKL